VRLLSGRSGDVRRPVGRPSLTADGARDPSAADAMAVAVLRACGKCRNPCAPPHRRLMQSSIRWLGVEGIS